MYEDQTYEVILERALSRVATDVDKREGSLIMNALASSAVEHANLYILLSGIAQNGYAPTAEREYLILRCKERGIFPYEATKAILKGKFNQDIPLESRFNLNDLNYTVTEFIEMVGGYYYYKLECETAGTIGNKYFGKLSPIEYVAKNLEGELVEVLIHAEDDEDTEALRKRYSASFGSISFGGNQQDYRERAGEIPDVGGVVILPVWRGGGTVKVVIINSDYGVASTTLVSTAQNIIDPAPQGTGAGTAPIGHTVTVGTPTEVPVNVAVHLTFSGTTWNTVKLEAEQIIKDYLLELRQTWEEKKGNLTVYISQIEARLLNIEGVTDITGTTKINGVGENLVTTAESLPVYGGVTNG